jgi:hypothetical protein
LDLLLNTFLSADGRGDARSRGLREASALTNVMEHPAKEAVTAWLAQITSNGNKEGPRIAHLLNVLTDKAQEIVDRDQAEARTSLLLPPRSPKIVSELVAFATPVIQLLRMMAGSATDPGGDSPQYVTLDMMAAIVSKHKSTLERCKRRQNNPLPLPKIEGGGGKADEWLWDVVRPWLEAEYSRQLPERYPALPRRGPRL